jgi:hypothetical protein
MALFFDIKLLEELACNDPYKFMALLEYHRSGGIAKSKFSRYKPATKSLSGNSYILNPDRLFSDRTTDILFKIQYIKLAARRDFSLWKFHKYKSIQLSYYPDINLEAAKHNPLLIVTDKEIHFKYE